MLKRVYSNKKVKLTIKMNKIKIQMMRIAKMTRSNNKIFPLFLQENTSMGPPLTGILLKVQSMKKSMKTKRRLLWMIVKKWNNLTTIRLFSK